MPVFPGCVGIRLRRTTSAYGNGRNPSRRPRKSHSHPYGRAHSHSHPFAHAYPHVHAHHHVVPRPHRNAHAYVYPHAYAGS